MYYGFNYQINNIETVIHLTLIVHYLSLLYLHLIGLFGSVLIPDLGGKVFRHSLYLACFSFSIRSKFSKKNNFASSRSSSCRLCSKFCFSLLISSSRSFILISSSRSLIQPLYVRT